MMKNLIIQELNLTDKFIEKMKVRSKKSITTKYNCSICKDTGLILKDKRKNIYTDCICVRKEKINKIWTSFGVKLEEVKSLDKYEVYNNETKRAKEKAIKYIESIKENKYYWFCLFGAPGGGKTHISKALGKALIEEEKEVIYISYIEAIRNLKSMMILKKEDYLKELKKYEKIEVLIIDDLFKDKISNNQMLKELNEADLRLIYTILNYRYQNNLRTIISTECTPDLLFKIDGALAGRILEKCGKSFGQIFTNESNYRVRRWN